MNIPSPGTSPSGAETLLAGLDRVLVGPFAPFRAGLVTAPHVDAVPLPALLDPDHVAAMVARFDRRFGHTDRRAVVSIWAAWHFTAVLPPLLAAAILLDGSPVLDLARVGFVLSPDRRANAIAIGPATEDLAGLGGPGRFHPLVRVYLAPLITHIADRTLVTERVLWSNAGNTLDAFLRRIAGEAGHRDGFLAARDLLAMRIWPDGWTNPLFDTVRDIEGRRVRRVCCMRLLVPDAGLCDACPIERDEAGPVTGTRRG